MVLLLFQWMSEVKSIMSEDPALTPLLQPFPKIYRQDSPELIEVIFFTELFVSTHDIHLF